MNTVLRAILDWRTVSPEDLACWQAQLDPEKRARVESFRRADDRTRSICADPMTAPAASAPTIWRGSF